MSHDRVGPHSRDLDRCDRGRDLRRHRHRSRHRLRLLRPARGRVPSWALVADRGAAVAQRAPALRRRPLLCRHPAAAGRACAAVRPFPIHCRRAGRRVPDRGRSVGRDPVRRTTGVRRSARVCACGCDPLRLRHHALLHQRGRARVVRGTRRIDVLSLRGFPGRRTRRTGRHDRLPRWHLGARAPSARCRNTCSCVARGAAWRSSWSSPPWRS